MIEIEGYTRVAYIPAIILVELCEEFLQTSNPTLTPTSIYPWTTPEGTKPPIWNVWLCDILAILKPLAPPLNPDCLNLQDMDDLARLRNELAYVRTGRTGRYFMWPFVNTNTEHDAKPDQTVEYHAPLFYDMDSQRILWKEGVERPVWTPAQHTEHILMLKSRIDYNYKDFYGHWGMKFKDLEESRYSDRHAITYAEFSSKFGDVFSMPILLDPLVQDGVVWDTLRLKDGWHRLIAYLLYNPLTTIKVALRDDVPKWLYDHLSTFDQSLNPPSARGEVVLKDWWQTYDRLRLSSITSKR